MPTPGDQPLRARLRAALLAAMKERDSRAVVALRGALDAIDNAEAVETRLDSAPMYGGPIAGAGTGLGAAEVARRELSGDQVAAIVHDEVAGRVSADDEYDCGGRHLDAERLRTEAALLAAHLDEDW